MNCKPGDLAIIVRALPNSPNLGRLVRVLEAQAALEFEGRVWSNPTSPCWIVEAVGSKLAVFSDDTHELTRWATRRPVPDRNLRPIRDQDSDEFLTTEKDTERQDNLTQKHFGVEE